MSLSFQFADEIYLVLDNSRDDLRPDQQEDAIGFTTPKVYDGTGKDLSKNLGFDNEIKAITAIIGNSADVKAFIDSGKYPTPENASNKNEVESRLFNKVLAHVVAEEQKIAMGRSTGIEYQATADESVDIEKELEKYRKEDDEFHHPPSMGM